LARTQTRTSQPNKNSKYSIISNPRPCATLVLRCVSEASRAPLLLPCAPRVLPLPPPLYAAHPLTRSPPRFRYEPLRAARRAHPSPIPGRSARRDHSASCSRLHALPPWSYPSTSHEPPKSATVGAPAEICDDRSSSIREDRSSRAAPYEDNRSPNPAAAALSSQKLLSS
jgi:hypothetical protein